MPSSATDKSVTDKEIRIWLRKWYPLLLSEQAESEFEKAVRTVANPTSELELELIGRQFDDRRQQQWLTLKQRALIAGQQTEFARRALGYLICAASFGSDCDDFAYWLATESAQTIKYLASSEPFSELLFEQITMLLASTHGQRTGCFTTLLQALNELTALSADRKWAGAANEAILFALNSSVERTQPCPSEEEAYQRILIRHLQQNRYRPAMASLQALADHHPLESVRAVALEAQLQLSIVTVQSIYDETTADQFSSIEGRAGRLSEALTKNYDGPAIVQELFTNCKGCPLSGNDDPRLASIFSLTLHAEPQVAIAAAWMLSESSQIPAQMKEPSLRTLVEFAESADLLLARQAEEVLAALSGNSHSLIGIIESARLAVRLRSAQQHTGN